MHDSIFYYYINLAHRTDRNDHMINQFKDYNITNYERIEAVKHTRPPIGCSSSHIITLEKFIQSQLDYCIIMEDDFQFTVQLSKYNQLLNILFSSDIDWNIVLLAGNVLKASKYNNFLKKCVDVQTTSGYLVHRKFANKLLDNYKTGKELFEQKHNGNKYALDRYWKRLQNTPNKFFIFNPKCGKQLASYSDIQKKKTNYGC